MRVCRALNAPTTQHALFFASVFLRRRPTLAVALLLGRHNNLSQHLTQKQPNPNPTFSPATHTHTHTLLASIATQNKSRPFQLSSHLTWFAPPLPFFWAESSHFRKAGPNHDLLGLLPNSRVTSSTYGLDLRLDTCHGVMPDVVGMTVVIFAILGCRLLLSLAVICVVACLVRRPWRRVGWVSEVKPPYSPKRGRVPRLLLRGGPSTHTVRLQVSWGKYQVLDI